MSLAFEPWLPPAAEGEVERAAMAAVTPWAQDWLPGWMEPGVGSRAERAGEEMCWSGDAGSAVGVSSAARTKLGLTLVEGRADPDNPADRAVLDRLADMAIADLGERLASPAGERAGQTPAEDYTVLRLSLGDERWFLLLSLGARTRIALRKAAAGRSKRPVLGNLGEAVAPELVPIGCHIGAAALSAGDVAGLAIGDLITFERRLADDLPLTVASRVAPRGKARMVDDGAGPTVCIVESIELHHS